MKLRLSALALGTTLLVGCASSGEQTGRSDPLEGFNRTMYNFNYNVLDPYVVRPVAVAWRDYVPQPARNGLSNFTSNLEEPAVMVNYFLQGDPYQGMVHFTRFFLNTLLGMGGFIDVAGMANQKLQREQPHRFGSTWAVMAWVMVRICSCHSTAALLSVMMAAIWSIRCIRCCRG
jgi:phospholipid-binding lipoprotein MlaA